MKEQWKHVMRIVLDTFKKEYVSLADFALIDVESTRNPAHLFFCTLRLKGQKTLRVSFYAQEAGGKFTCVTQQQGPCVYVKDLYTMNVIDILTHFIKNLIDRKIAQQQGRTAPSVIRRMGTT